MNKRIKFIYNKPTNHVANISKLRNIGYKLPKQNLKRFFSKKNLNKPTKDQNQLYVD